MVDRQYMFDESILMFLLLHYHQVRIRYIVQLVPQPQQQQQQQQQLQPNFVFNNGGFLQHIKQWSYYTAVGW